jgi:hypothetical protein
MKKNLLSIMVVACIFFCSTKNAVSQISEAFNDITTLAGSGWSLQNLSTPVGSTNWFQGNPLSAGGPFDAFNGATNAYIGANYNNTGSTGTISNWLMTPNVTLRNGDVFTFYTRKVVPAPTDYPDRLEVRMSTNGASTNAGTNATTVGDFTTLLLSINPSLVLGGYPTAWTQYTITISGLAAPTSGRLAFRYFVTGAGSSGSNSDYIGIDQFNYTPYVCPVFTMTPGGSLTGGTAGSAYSTTLTQTGALGAPSFAVTAGALPPGLTLATGGNITGTPTATGTFNFTVTVSDASGCTGSQSYSITIVCPINGASLSTFPALCNNGTPYTLIEGSPAGGTYSGTGVSGGQFDPSAGSQIIIYDLTDAYGCAQSANASITVNTAPTVGLSPFTAACNNGSPVTLTEGSPAGGTYSGTNVSGGMFDPSAGTQTITYSYTDANACSNSASGSFPVNTAPTVTLASFTPACNNQSPITLTGGSPAGGTYSGTGVSAGQFDPSTGTQNITYTYTDANGCTNIDAQSLTVNPPPTATLSSFTDACSYNSPITLSGGSPAGGIFSGTGVSGGMFDPSTGTQNITYTYTDANGCSDSDAQTFTVNSQPPVGLLAANNNPCVTNAAFALTGSPTGGTYFGTGVTGSSFNPATAGIGSHIVSYTYTDGTTGCADTATTTIVVIGCAGIENNVNANITVFPNPADEIVSVTLQSVATNGNWKFELNTLDGKTVFVKEVFVAGAQYTESINISTLSTGTYFIKISNNTGGMITKKFVKK